MKLFIALTTLSSVVGSASASGTTSEPSFSMAPSPAPFPATAEPSFSMMPTGIDKTPPSCESTKVCEYFDYTASGEKVAHGTYVSDQWYALGFYISAVSDDGGYTPDGKARIMDTAHPGSDKDLGSPNKYCAGGGPGEGAGGVPGTKGENCDYEGNVVIIQEESDRDVDDNAYGGNVTFTFTKKVTLLSMGVMDLMPGEGFLDIKKYGGLSYIQELAGYGDNSVEDVIIEKDSVKSVTLSIEHSGAIRYICYCDTEGEEPTMPTPTPTPSKPSGDYCIDFSFDTNGKPVGHGDYVSDEWAAWGLDITVYPGEGGYAPDGKGRIMDTATPGSDIDLGSPNKYCTGGGPGEGAGGVPGATGENCDYEGNVLIIQEESDRDVDDNAYGGSIKFSFSSTATLKSIGLMDLDNGGSASLDIKKSDGYWQPNMPIYGLGDNSVQDFYFSNMEDVSSLQLNVVMSGAVRYICYSL